MSDGILRWQRIQVSKWEWKTQRTVNCWPWGEARTVHLRKAEYRNKDVDRFGDGKWKQFLSESVPLTSAGNKAEIQSFGSF